jgi:DNA polymerase-3 subunit alpha
MEIDVFEPVTDAILPLRVKVSPGALSEPLIDQLKGVLTEHPGDSPVFLHLGERQVLRLPETFNVHAGNGLVAELRVLLGAGAILA